MTKRHFSAKCERAKTHLQLRHTCGPVNIEASGASKYFITFIDNYSRYRYAYLMQRKCKTFEKFKQFHAKAEKQLSESIKTLRSNRGGKYMDYEFKDHLIENGII